MFDVVVPNRVLRRALRDQEGLREDQQMRIRFHTARVLAPCAFSFSSDMAKHNTLKNRKTKQTK